MDGLNIEPEIEKDVKFWHEQLDVFLRKKEDGEADNTGMLSRSAGGIKMSFLHVFTW